MFKMTYDNSTYTICCRRFKPFGQMRCGVGSYTYTYLHHAERTQEPIAVYLDIEIEMANH